MVPIKALSLVCMWRQFFTHFGPSLGRVQIHPKRPCNILIIKNKHPAVPRFRNDGVRGSNPLSGTSTSSRTIRSIHCKGRSADRGLGSCLGCFGQYAGREPNKEAFKWFLRADIGPIRNGRILSCAIAGPDNQLRSTRPRTYARPTREGIYVDMRRIADQWDEN